MRLKSSFYFMNGTTLEMDCDKFMVDHMNRCIAVEVGTDPNFNESYLFPLENLKYWKLKRNGVVQ